MNRNNNNNNNKNRRPRRLKRNNNNNNDRRISNGLINSMIRSPFPATCMVKATQSFPVRLFSALNAWAVIDIRANDVFDPAGTGFSPPGVSTLLTVYRLFKVHRAKCRLNLTNEETTTPLNAAMMFNDTQPSTIVNSLDTANLYSATQFGTGPRLCSGNSGQDRITCFLDMDMGNILGDPRQYYGGAAYSGSDAASPTQTLWLGLIAFATDASLMFPSGLSGTLTIEYTVKFFSLRITP